MHITSLEITGFKLHRRKKTFNFGQVTEITGGNGKGKSTIAEAITWCFYGSDLNGNTKGIFDRLRNPDANETKIVVEASLPVNNELVSYSFCRLRKGKTTELFLNGQPAKQLHFDGILGRMEMFLSVFVPGYFGSLSASEPAKGRNLLVSMLPQLDHQEVASHLHESDIFRIVSLDMINPDHCMKKLRTERADLEKQLDKAQGKIEYLLANSMLDVSMKVIEEDRIKLKTLQAQLQELLQEGSQPKQHDMTVFQERKASLRADFDARLSEFRRIQELPLPVVGDPCPECGHSFSAENAIEEMNKRDAKLLSIQSECDRLKRIGHDLVSEMMHLSDENVKLQSEFFKQRGRRILSLQETIAHLQEIQNDRDNKLKMADDLSKQYTLYDEIVKEQNEKGADIQALRNFMLQYAQMQVDYVNSFLNLTEVHMFTINAGGEITLDFKILYDKKEYKSLSTSEKIRASIELASLINQVQGKSYPIYIDNAESIEDFNAPHTQYFVATVVKQKSLSVQIVA